MAQALSSTYGKLNLGCGSKPIAGHLNIDIRPLPHVDLVADVRYLCFSENCFTDIVAHDIIEHLTYLQAIQLLENCYRWLQPHGVLHIHTGNLAHIVALILMGGEPHVDEAMRWLFGSNGSPGTDFTENFHRWCYNAKSLSDLLIAAGFTVNRVYTDCFDYRLNVKACKE